MEPVTTHATGQATPGTSLEHETMLDRALALWELGFHIFPLGSPNEPPPQSLIERSGSEAEARNQWPKTPRIAWREFQDRQATEAEIRQWWSQWPDANIALVTGVQFYVVDADTPWAVTWCENPENLTPALATVDTGRGRHFFYKANGLEVRNFVGDGTGIDIRARGGYVVAPGSVHANGTRYTLQIASGCEDAWPDDLTELGQGDLDAIKGAFMQAPPVVEKPGHVFAINTAGISLNRPPLAVGDGFHVNTAGISAERREPPDETTGTAKGSRNTKLARLAGRWIHEGCDLATARAKAAAWNELNRQPLSPGEVERTIQSVAATHQRNTGAAVPETPEQARELAEAPKAWPELVPLDSASPPPLDVGLLPGCVGRFARALAVDTETPPELAFAMVLAACSTAAARRVHVQVKPGYSEPLNIWIAAALESANRKSAVQTAATQPLQDWEFEQGAILRGEISRATSELRTQEARAKELRSKAARAADPAEAKDFAQQAADIEENMAEVPKPPQLWTSDATPERLGQLLADNSECMAWLSSEAGMFDILAGRYSAGIPNLDLVLKAHAGDAERVDRGSRPPVYLRCPRLTIGLSPQPSVLRGLASRPGFRGRGLLARFWYLVPCSPLGSRPLEDRPVPESDRRLYAAAIAAMLDWPAAHDEQGRETTWPVTLSPEAFSAWHGYRVAIECEFRPGGQWDTEDKSWAGKAPGAAVRLAGILHCIEHAHARPWETPISEATMRAALTLMDIISQHTLAALGMMGADPDIEAARHVWSWVERRRLPVFTIREAFQALKGTFPKVANLLPALNVLAERGYLEIQEPAPSGGPGRPASPAVLVRPDIVEQWA